MAKLSQVFRVSVKGIQLGMFVSRLDRPWLETSFPLQGFEIRSEDELQKLQRICSHVYVDIAVGASPDPRFVELDDTDAGRGGAQPRRDRGPAQDQLGNRRPTSTASWRQADAAHDTLERGLDEVMDDLKDGRELDLQSCRTASTR